MRHRTALVTAGSIAAVVLAAGIAMGANLGILNAADSRPVGKLSAVAAVQAGGEKVVQAYSSGQTRKTQASPEPQKYVIRKTGTLSVVATRRSLRLAAVTVRHGWTWSLSQTSDRRLTVTFRSGGKTYTFLAKLGPRGALVARVDEPVTRVVPAAPSTVAVSSPVGAVSAPAAVSPASAPASSSHGEPGEGGGHAQGGGADD